MKIEEREELELALSELYHGNYLDDEKYEELYDALWCEDEGEQMWAKYVIERKLGQIEIKNKRK